MVTKQTQTPTPNTSEDNFLWWYVITTQFKMPRLSTKYSPFFKRLAAKLLLVIFRLALYSNKLF